MARFRTVEDGWPMNPRESLQLLIDLHNDHPARPLVASPTSPTPARQAAKPHPTPASPPRFARTCLAAPIGVSSIREFRGVGQRIRFQPGCFESFLRQVHLGNLRCELLVEHGQRLRAALATTADGGIDVFAGTSGVYLSMTSKTAAAADQFPHLAALSIGFTPIECRAGRDERGPVLDVLKATAGEVSLVAASAFPGTFSNPVMQVRNEALARLRAG